MIATSIEQSKRLLDAGINPKTADMSLIYTHSSNGDMKWMLSSGKYNRYGALEPEGRVVPAWSIGALWDIFNATGLIFMYEISEHTSEELIESMVTRLVALKMTESL